MTAPSSVLSPEFLRAEAGVRARATHAVELAVEVEAISKAFGARRVVDAVSFRVRRGEFLALLGPSGAGKTTLIRSMAGITPPDSGRVLLAGVDVASLPRRERRRIAVVFQQFNLVGRLSALDNVLAGRLGHVPTWRGVLRRFTRADRLLAFECLERVGLLEHAAQRADTLSGGQQQRVAIARALAQQPEAILADEPIASLDPQISAGILGLLRDICHTDGVAVVCSLHQLHFARDFADGIVGIAAGRVVIERAAADFSDDDAARLYAEGPRLS